MGTAPDASRPALRRRALWLEYATIGWNVGEAVLTVGLGIAAGSLALIGFGTDSVIEVFASAVVVWHIRPHTEADHPDRTRLALRLVAAAFLVLAMALSVLAVRDLVTGREADASPLGIAYLAVTAVVMFGLAAAKRRTAVALQSAPLRSEAAMTYLDGVLSVLTLTGLTLNALAGWAWADPTAALIVAVAALNESRENWQEAGELEVEA
jgi:divalent metal cation (Fe/Co/Zn/Cd) transporter